MTTQIELVMTEAFLDDYSDPHNKQDEIATAVETEWNSYIEDSNGDYAISVGKQTSTDAVVPESHLSNTSLEDRAEDADSYLSAWHPQLMNSVDAALIIDYFGPNNPPGINPGPGNAGKSHASNTITAAVDIWHEDNDDLDLMTLGVMSEGIALHEILHFFYDPDTGSEIHTDKCSTRYGLNYESYTIMCVPDGSVGCNDPTDPVYQNFITSDCTTSVVRSHIDTYID